MSGLACIGRLGGPYSLFASIIWREGQNSALDKARISEGRDIGNVTVTRNGQDMPYSADFTFAFHAFFPKSPIEKMACALPEWAERRHRPRSIAAGDSQQERRSVRPWSTRRRCWAAAQPASARAPTLVH